LPPARGEATEGNAAVSLEQNVEQGNSDAGEIGGGLSEIATGCSGIRCHWRTLDHTPATLALARSWLSAGEQARMMRFGSTLLQDRYAMGRASLRFLLGRHLGVAPQRVPIVRGARGRPQLANISGIDFNVSHTENIGLFAIATANRIGVDIERASRIINARGIARKFLTEEERTALDSLSDDGARMHVLRLWTCKEAMSKATGDALSAPFAKIQVEISPALRLSRGPAPYDPEQWSLSALPLPPDFIATLALWRI
jgi:4'-phosphopantetheinyl transferase